MMAAVLSNYTNSAANVSSESPFNRILETYEHPHWNHFYKTAELPAKPWVYVSSGAYVTTIGVLGAIGNALLLWAFTCSSTLRSPSNLLIANLALADLGMSTVSFPLLAASSYAGKWLFGKIGCDYYVVSAGIFGMLSVSTMAAIAVDRFGSITRWSKWCLTWQGACMIIIGLWVYALVMMLPPMFGWSRFILEGIQTSCTFDFFTRDIETVSYVLYLVVIGYCIPLVVIAVCYVAIVRHLIRHRKLMANSGFAVNGDLAPRRRTRTNSSLPAKWRRWDQSTIENDIKATVTCSVIVGLFLLAWTPYAIVSLIGVYGDQSLLTPTVNALPSLFAKSSAVYNPIVYAFLNDKFRLAIQALVLRQNSTRRQSSQIIYMPRASITEHLRLSLARNSDPTMGDIHVFCKARRDTLASMKTLTPGTVSSPLSALTEECTTLSRSEFFPSTLDDGVTECRGYFFEPVGPGLKYGKFHSPTSPDVYWDPSQPSVTLEDTIKSVEEIFRPLLY